MSKFPDVDFIYLNINKLLSSVVRGIQKIPWKAENNCWMLSWKYYQLYCLAHYWNLCSDNHICVAKGCYALNHSDHLLLAFSIHTTAYTTVITILLPPFFLQWPSPPPSTIYLLLPKNLMLILLPIISQCAGSLLMVTFWFFLRKEERICYFLALVSVF